ncbi:MAG: hypothetical protein ACXWZY_11175 [Gaiellaceae bacterium]
MNIWSAEWDATDDWSGGGAKSKRLVERGSLLGGERLWMIHDLELDPDASET